MKSGLDTAHTGRGGTYGKTFFDKMRCPIIVSQRRKLLSGQMWDTICLEDDVVHEKEENKRKPGGRLLRVDIRGWVLCSAVIRAGTGIKQLDHDELRDRMEYIELE